MRASNKRRSTVHNLQVTLMNFYAKIIYFLILNMPFYDRAESQHLMFQASIRLSIGV